MTGCSTRPAWPTLGEDWLEDLNPKSLITVEGAMATPRLAAAAVGDKYAPFVPSLM